MRHDPINQPAHYTMYPVEVIEITRHLGFCLGNAAKYVLRAPYKGGVEDLDKAWRYLEFEEETPQSPITASAYVACQFRLKMLVCFFHNSEGDMLWDDIAIQSAEFLEKLHDYLTLQTPGLLADMKRHVLELRRILSLRGMGGEIYEGMSGLPAKLENLDRIARGQA